MPDDSPSPRVPVRAVVVPSRLDVHEYDASPHTCRTEDGTVPGPGLGLRRKSVANTPRNTARTGSCVLARRRFRARFRLPGRPRERASPELARTGESRRTGVAYSGGADTAGGRALGSSR